MNEDEYPDSVGVFAYRNNKRVKGLYGIDFCRV